MIAALFSTIMNVGLWDQISADTTMIQVWLEKAFEDHDMEMVGLKTEPFCFRLPASNLEEHNEVRILRALGTLAIAYINLGQPDRADGITFGDNTTS